MPARADSRISITYDADAGRSQYVISSASYFDAGEYQCSALDAQGQTLSTSAVGTLTVQGELLKTSINPLHSSGEDTTLHYSSD